MAFLPRIENGHAVPGFTLVSIRYDLATGRFDAPSPIDAPIELPDDFVSVLSDDSDSGKQEDRIDPDEPLKIGSIPLEIQKKALKGECVLYLTLAEDRRANRIFWSSPMSDEQFRLWLEAYFRTVRWKPFPEKYRDRKCYIKVPVRYQTQICKIVFLEASIVEELPKTIMTFPGKPRGVD